MEKTPDHRGESQAVPRPAKPGHQTAEDHASKSELLRHAVGEGLERGRDRHDRKRSRLPEEPGLPPAATETRARPTPMAANPTPKARSRGSTVRPTSRARTRKHATATNVGNNRSGIVRATFAAFPAMSVGRPAAFKSAAHALGRPCGMIKNHTTATAASCRTATVTAKPKSRERAFGGRASGMANCRPRVAKWITETYATRRSRLTGASHGVYTNMPASTLIAAETIKSGVSSGWSRTSADARASI